MIPRGLPGSKAPRPRSAGVTPVVDSFGVALKPRCRQFNRCGSPALAARHSRFAHEGRQLCHLAVRQGAQRGTAEEAKRSNPEPWSSDDALELRPVAPEKRGPGGPVATGRAMALLAAAKGPQSPSRAEKALAASKFASSPGRFTPDIEESSGFSQVEVPHVVPHHESAQELSVWRTPGPLGLAEDLPNFYARQVSAPESTSERKVTSPKSALPDLGLLGLGERRGRLRVEEPRPTKSASPGGRSPRKNPLGRRDEVTEEVIQVIQVPRERIGWMPAVRFAKVKRGGKSSSPPRRSGPQESWREADHLPVDCMIRRRRHKKGPKEKLLIIPCVANLDDPRFQHLFETLEADQPDLLSESMLHLYP